MNNIVAYQPPAAPAVSYGPLLPNTIGEAMDLARMMADARMVPEHLRKSPADCFLVINQARLWRMDPFAVAQGTSFIHGKMMYEGKLIAGVVHSLGNLKGRLSYDYDGAGDNRSVTVSGTLIGEDKPRTVTVRLGDAKTSNKMWASQPDQQLAYHAARVWARRHTPEVLLGVYAAEEFDAPPMKDITPPDVKTAMIADLPPPPKPPKSSKPPIKVKLHDGKFAEFDRTGKGLQEAYDFLSAAVLDGAPEVVGLNNELLDGVARAYPAMEDDIAELRAAAAMMMAPKDDPSEPGALEPDEVDEFGLPPLGGSGLPEDPA